MLDLKFDALNTSDKINPKLCALLFNDNVWNPEDRYFMECRVARERETQVLHRLCRQLRASEVCSVKWLVILSLRRSLALVLATKSKRKERDYSHILVSLGVLVRNSCAGACVRGSRQEPWKWALIGVGL